MKSKKDLTKPSVDATSLPQWLLEETDTLKEMMTGGRAEKPPAWMQPGADRSL